MQGAVKGRWFLQIGQAKIAGKMAKGRQNARSYCSAASPELPARTAFRFVSYRFRVSAYTFHVLRAVNC